ncbi:MAG: hypothetical protein KGI60_01265 [Patescibacteria group bacterium]|nr:hypothetical protein [Patescibacteria group bacterium]
MNRSLYAWGFAGGSAIVAFFMATAPAYAFTARIDLQTLGNGSGQVVVSATSTNYYPLTGYNGESCSGTEDCHLGNLTPQSSKTVFVTFGQPTCSQGVYSSYGACQLDGYQYSHLISVIGPPGCTGDLPQTIKQPCSLSACGPAYTQNTGTVSGGEQTFINLITGALSNLLNGDISGAIGTLTGNSNSGQLPPEPTISSGQASPSQGTVWTDPQTGTQFYGGNEFVQIPGTFSGGGTDLGSEYDVNKSTATIIKVGELVPVGSQPPSTTGSTAEPLPAIPNVPLPTTSVNPIQVNFYIPPDFHNLPSADILPPENQNQLSTSFEPFNPTVPVAPPMNPCRQ